MFLLLFLLLLLLLLLVVLALVSVLWLLVPFLQTGSGPESGTGDVVQCAKTHQLPWKVVQQTSVLATAWLPVRKMRSWCLGRQSRLAWLGVSASFSTTTVHPLLDGIEGWCSELGRLR